MTPAKFRKAREQLGLTQLTVADVADLSLSTVQDYEEGCPVNSNLVDALRVTLESLGASFEDEPDGGAAHGYKDR